jgi:TPR repeat protein
MLELIDRLNLLIRGYSTDVDIGMCYQFGKHVQKNIVTAKRYYLQAINNNDPKAYMQMSDILKDEGKFTESIYFKAKAFAGMHLWRQSVITYEEAATLKDALSMYELGCIYQHDRSKDNSTVIKQDIVLACKWFRESYLNGHAEALRMLLELSISYDKAMLTVAQMYEAGEVNHQVDMKSSIQFYDLSSIAGNLDARHHLGELYESGAKDLSPNLLISHVYYLKAAQSKHKISLQALERITPVFTNDNYRMILADVYLSSFFDPVAALACLKNLADKNDKAAIEKINSLIEQDIDYAYQLGLLYANELPLIESEHCYNYFKLAAFKNHELALNALVEASNKDSPLALYYLGQVYEYQAKRQMAIDCYEKAAIKNNLLAMFNLAQIFSQDREIEPCIILSKDLSLQLKWLRKAAIGGYKPALDLLLVLSEKEGKVAFEVANLYESGELDGKEDFPTALRYLKTAAKLQDVDASYRLGNIYELGFKEIAINLEKSFKYYYISAKQKHYNSLLAIERISNSLNDNKYTYKLALLYLEQFDDDLSAYKCFITAQYYNDNDSHQYLINIGKTNAKAAKKIAELYATVEDQLFGYPYFLKFYAFAALNKDLDALKIIQDEAATGNPAAQYNLGYEYWFEVKETIKAIDCCMLAANQHHEDAAHFLRTAKLFHSRFLYIAQKYENGAEGVDKNIELAIFFYEKAFSLKDLKDKDSAFKLGELYYHIFLSNIKSIENTFDKACDYFIVAAKLGRKDSLVILNDLAEVMSPAIKVKIGHLYKDAPYRNVRLAEKWYQSAKEDGSLDAASQLKLLTDNNNTLFSPKKAKAPSPSTSTPKVTQSEFKKVS